MQLNRSIGPPAHLGGNLPARCAPRLLTCLFSLGAGIAPAAFAQAQPDEAGLDLPPLSHYTPDEVGLFVEIDQLPQISERLKDRTVWPVLLQLLGGDEASWQSILAKTLGVESNRAITRLFRERVALAAPDWHRLDEGIILLAQSDRRILRLLIDPRRRRRVRTAGRVRVTRTKTDLWIALAGQTVVLAQKQGPGTLFDQSIALLNGQAKNALAASEEFRTRVGDLPDPRFGLAFWRTPARATTTAPAHSLSRWWPPLRHGAMSVRLHGRRLEVAFRGAPRKEEALRYRPRVLLNPLTALPQTTLGAWATSIDPGELFETARRGASTPAPAQRLWDVIVGNTDAERFEEEVIANVGPRCLFFLGADISKNQLPPQLGFMIESVDARSVVETLRRVVEGVVETVGAPDGHEPAMVLSASEHLGAVIYELHLARPSSEAAGDTLASLIAESLTPSFAAVKGWVVLTSSPSYLRQVIDASSGVAPRLGEVLSLDDQGEHLRKSISTAVIQPSFAAGALRYWDSLLRERDRVRRTRARIGVSVHTSPAPGMVIIADVHSNGPAAGFLEPGDAVIACNGHLLEMKAPNEHLKKLLVDAPPRKTLRLRLLREGTILERTIAPPEVPLPAPGPTGLTTLLDKLAPVEHFVLELAIATYSVARPDDGAYQAQLVFDFERPAPPPEADTEPASP